MNKFLCVLSLFSCVSACDLSGDDGLALSGQYPVGDLKLNNKTTWTVTDIATGPPDNDKFCIMALPPGASMILGKIYAPATPRTLTVTFKDTDGTLATETYQVTVASNAVTVVDLEGLPGCDDYAPPSGKVTVSYQ